MALIEYAKKINELSSKGESLESIKLKYNFARDKWLSCCQKAYAINSDEAKKKRRNDKNEKHKISTTVQEISDIIELNNEIGKYALLLPIFSTMADFNAIDVLKKELPDSENRIINYIGKVTMHPKMRVWQKQGRIEKFDHFKPFATLVDAALLSYYRTNFISCYFTLLPVIEGILIRWMGFNETDIKPQFEDIRKFFKVSATQNTNPSNILFHNVYIKVCDKILNEHFYRPTKDGNAHSLFNRNISSHLLTEKPFATKENCIRLFILLDTMTEIFFYESGKNDPRFEIGPEEIEKNLAIFSNAFIECVNATSEHILLGTLPTDLLYR
jgi:hypothetical protein